MSRDGVDFNGICLVSEQDIYNYTLYITVYRCICFSRYKAQFLNRDSEYGCNSVFRVAVFLSSS